jgi:molecular chaperone IbpA
MEMRTVYDFSPLYRSMIGVDRVADLIETAMKDRVENAYPPYDVEKTAEHAYRITLAAAGFSPDELEVTAQPGLLIVTGKKSGNDEGRHYLHQGIGGRGFERRFELADYVIVKAARYEHGVLSIDLAREVPDAMKPRRVEIDLAGAPQAVRKISNDHAERKAA